jgi:hypothetical protein
MSRALELINKLTLIESILHVDNNDKLPITIYHNPSVEQTKNLVDRSGSVRGTYHPKHGLFLWDAYDSIHYHMRNALNKQHGFNIPTDTDGSSENHRDFDLHKGKIYMHSSNDDKHENYIKHKNLISSHPSFSNLNFKMTVE